MSKFRLRVSERPAPVGGVYIAEKIYMPQSRYLWFWSNMRMHPFSDREEAMGVIRLEISRRAYKATIDKPVYLDIPD